MAATANKAALQAMRSKLQAMGLCRGGVTIGEPKSPPADMTAAIIMDNGEIDETVLNAPREVHRAIIRFYANMLADPRENIEFDLDQARAQIEADVFGDFELGGTVAYALPTQYRWQYGYQQIGEQQAARMYRMLDLTIAYRVDPASTFTA